MHFVGCLHAYSLTACSMDIGHMSTTNKATFPERCWETWLGALINKYSYLYSLMISSNSDSEI